MHSVYALPDTDPSLGLLVSFILKQCAFIVRVREKNNNNNNNGLLVRKAVKRNTSRSQITMRDKGSGIQIKTSVVSASLQARATLAHSECHTDWYQMTKQPFVFMQQRRGTTYQQNSGFNWNLLFAFLLDYIYTSTTRCPISPTL